MKTLFASVVLSLGTLLAQAQITTVKIEPRQEADTVRPYDSLSSISLENAAQHVGQTIYLREDEQSKQWGGYLLVHLHTRPAFEMTDRFLYKSVPKKDRPESRTCDYESLKGKSFRILRLLEQESGATWRKDKMSCLEMTETAGRDTVYLFFYEYFDPFRYFLTVGYFEKLKQTYTGKEFYYLGKSEFPLDEHRSVRRLDGTEADIPPMTKLRCTDISLQEGGDNGIVALLTDSAGNRMYVNADDVIHTSPNSLRILQTTQEYEQGKARERSILKKYGPANGKLINGGKVRIGFTKAMCTDAWGEPGDKNITTGSFGRHEQWVYGDSYLYFENGTLTAIQD